MGMLSTLIAFVLSVAGLVYAAKLFTNAAEIIGIRFGLKPFVVGVIIVSVGTSLPELIASIVSVQAGQSEIVSGNVIGSSVSNILFVLGLTVMVSRKRIDLGSQYIYVDLNFLAGAAFIAVVSMYDGVVTWNEAAIGLLAYVVYIFYLLQVDDTDADLPSVPETPNEKALWQSFAWLVISAFLIYFSARYTVSTLSLIAVSLGVSSTVISMTLLSFGTTLPESVVSISAARAGKAELAVGNVLGSCIFNSLGILGLASLFGHLEIPKEVVSFSLPAFAAIVLLFYLLAQDKKISRYEGALLVLLYILFIGKVSNCL
jgi:cation:H+ antiporter